MLIPCIKYVNKIFLISIYIKNKSKLEIFFLKKKNIRFYDV